MHAWQVLVSRLHEGVAPEQCVLFVHSTHAPVISAQRGALSASTHSSDAPHGSHVCVAVSQMGAVPLQSADVTQPTHTEREKSQIGVSPVHVSGHGPPS